MQIQETQRGDYFISTDKSKLDIVFIHQFLSTESYWAKNIPIDVVKKSIEGSLCFGLYLAGRQIGFARMITDGATFGYLCDVFIDNAHRGKGLSKWLMQTVMQHPDLQGLRRISLATKDAHGLYEQIGFKPLNDADRFMQIKRENPYGG
ncbi:GNAT family N-acetyltransferase [Pinibacter aurantiacus]|uniref:GNAT family N-acetyltransferase n=1 Tax=Pinibacter aurantiacus TaxID=2851599 RepID=A0A9E2W352_9BACT|nr:GNAT family N-acetyltransferase [Pinibacter aurantiacus]MBV4356449.1 GNAT family N-acetyltransferase [Pinibacter aurantiacus]